MNVAKSLVLSVTLSLVAFLPRAQAADLSSMMRNFAGNAGGWSAVDSCRNELEAGIAAALSVGQFTPTQAADYRGQLRQIADAEAQSKSAGTMMSFVQAISFSRQLDALSAQIQQAMQNTVASLPDVDIAQTHLKDKIEAAFTGGRISLRKAAELRVELVHVADAEASYKTETGGHLSPRQLELLAEHFNEVKAHLEQEVKIGESALPALDAARADLQKKISDLATAGRLNGLDAAHFNQDLGAIAAQQANFQADSDGLNEGQVVTLATSFDQLNSQIDGSVSSAARADGLK